RARSRTHRRPSGPQAATDAGRRRLHQSPQHRGDGGIGGRLYRQSAPGRRGKRQPRHRALYGRRLRLRRRARPLRLSGGQALALRRPAQTQVRKLFLPLRSAGRGLSELSAQATMLSRQSASRSGPATDGRNRGHDRFSPEDGHPRSAEAVSPTQPGDRVLPCLDQKQTGIAPVPPARLGQSANGNAVGLPHLQPATVDPPAQTTTRNRLNPQRRDGNRETPCANQTTPPVSATPSPTRALFQGLSKMVFSQLLTASLFEKWPAEPPTPFDSALRGRRSDLHRKQWPAGVASRSTISA